MKLIFTSIGRRVVYVRQIRAAAERLGVELTIVGTDIDPLAPALNDVDVAVRAPRWSDDGYVDFLHDLCRSTRADLIAPLTDPDARILALHRPAFEARGTAVAAVGANLSDVIDDKWQTAEFFRECGVSVPPTWLTVPDIDPAVPLLIKPRRGSAGKGIGPVVGGSTVPLPDDCMVQQKVSGPEYTVDVFCGLDGSLQSIGMRQRLEVRAGEVSKARTVYDSDVERDLARVVPRLDAVGPITLQCFVTDDGPKFIEINGRAGGGIPLSIHAGSRSDELLVGLLSQRPEGVARARADEYMTRYDDQYFSTGEPTRFEAP